jgi:phage-related protein
MLKQSIFLGNSKDVIASFSQDAKNSIGIAIYKLQLGLEPRNWKPMSSIGQGVCEIRERDKDGIFRVIYVLRISNKVHILHAFQKKSQKTEQRDIDLAKARLKQVIP